MKTHSSKDKIKTAIQAALQINRLTRELYEDETERDQVRLMVAAAVIGQLVYNSGFPLEDVIEKLRESVRMFDEAASSQFRKDGD